MPRSAYYQAHRADLAERERAAYYTRRGLPVPPKSSTGRIGGSGRAPTVRFTPPPAPIPVLDPHPLVDQAIELLRPYERHELGSDFDSVAKDLVGEYVVAALAGEDPVAALVAERARYRHDRASLVFGTSLVDGLDR